MQHLTREEFKRLLNAIPGAIQSGPRSMPDDRKRLMFLVTYHHGLRVSETIGLTAAHIRGGFVQIKRLKGSEKTTQPYVYDPDPELDESAALSALAQALKSQDRLFPITRGGFLKLMKAAGLRAGISEGSRYDNKLHPHALKHSVALHMIEEMEMGIHEVKQRLGHKSLSSTGAYLRISDEKAARAYAQAISARKKAS